MNDLISRQDAIDGICMDWCGVYHKDCTHPFDISHDDYYYCNGCIDVETIKALPSRNRIQRMCFGYDEVLKDSEYNRIMDGLNAYWKERNEHEQSD